MGKWLAAALVAIAIGCGAGDNRLDPGDLELRDLLGISPEVASTWDADQRAAARHVLGDGLEAHDAAARVGLATATTVDDRVTRSLASLDATRVAAGADALGVVNVELGASELTAVGRTAPTGLAVVTNHTTTPSSFELRLADRWAKEPWGQLPDRGHDVLLALAIDAGHTTGTLVVVPAPRLTVIAGYLPARGAESARLVVNPILLAALDPGALDVAQGTDPTAATADTTASGAAAKAAIDDDVLGGGHLGNGPVASTGGNPYSFYGSVAECAAAQRSRCDHCLGSSSCKPVTSTIDGNAECDEFGADGGRGYFLICINLSLAISSVETCTAAASSCARVTDAASDLSKLAANANFLDDSACSQALDGCLTKIYGAPSGSFPGADGGLSDDPPRSTAVSCGDACSSNNCEASPSCSGPSCGNSLSCDSTCSNSTDQKGCAGNCDGCKSSGGGAGNGGGGCSDTGNTSSGDCSGNGDSCGGSSGGCGGSSSSGSCGGSSSSSSSGGSSCGGGSGGCGGSSGGGCGGGGSGGCSGGGGGGGCSVVNREPDARVVLTVSVMWGFLPVPVAALIRRRAKKRRKATGKPTTADDAGVAS